MEDGNLNVNEREKRGKRTGKRSAERSKKDATVGRFSLSRSSSAVGWRRRIRRNWNGEFTARKKKWKAPFWMLEVLYIYMYKMLKKKKRRRDERHAGLFAAYCDTDRQLNIWGRGPPPSLVHLLRALPNEIPSNSDFKGPESYAPGKWLLLDLNIITYINL